MPDAKAEKAAAPARREATRTDEEYLAQLAKEFESIPDREVPPAESQSEDQLTAMNQARRITAKPEKDSVDQRNVAITKTIRAAMADIKISR